MAGFSFETVIPEKGDRAGLAVWVTGLPSGIKGDQLMLSEVEQIITYWESVRDFWWATKKNA